MRKLLIVVAVAFFIFMVFASCSCAAIPLRTTPVHPIESFIFIDKRATVMGCVGQTCKAVKERTTGSGFAVSTSDKGTVGITAAHVCKTPQTGKPFWLSLTTKESSMKATLFSGETVDVEVLAVYEAEDLCVFLVRGVFLPYVPMASSPPNYGEEVHTLAAPLGIYEPQAVPIFTGRFFGTFAKKGMDLYSVPSIFGSSGSPILNSSGRLVGVTSKAYPAFPQVAVSPQFKHLHKLVSSIKKGHLPYSLSGEGL